MMPPPPAVLEPAAERRYNTWDGKTYTLDELRRWGSRVSWSEEELQEHWDKHCKPLAPATGAPAGAGAAGAGVAEVGSPEQVLAWRRMWTVKSLQSMWTKADSMHVHAISGAAYTVVGAVYLLNTAAGDVAALSGGAWGLQMPWEVVCCAMALGVINAASALQPALIAKSANELPALLGFGPDANLRSGGFINACLFYCILTYQGLRALPSFPPTLAALDPLVGAASLLGMAQTASILNGWVAKGALHRVDALLIPSALNLPVALHLLFQGQAWADELAMQYPQWPEVFFFANFALAWALSMVTFLLSLYERRVISLEARSFIMVTFPALVFAAIPLHVAVHIPEWFKEDWMTILTLSVPGV